MVLHTKYDPAVLLDETRLENRRLRGDLERLQERLEQERKEARHRNDELRDQFDSERRTLQDAVSVERTRGDGIAQERDESRSALREEVNQVKLSQAFKSLELLGRIRQLEDQGEELQKCLDTEREARGDLEQDLSASTGLSRKLEDSLDDALAEIDALREDLSHQEELAEEAREEASAASSATAQHEARVEQLTAELKQTRETRDVAISKAQLEVVELLVPIVDLVRYSRAAQTLAQTHALLEQVIDRFYELGFQVGRPPEEMLTATECAKLLKVSKRRLRAIPQSELPYQVVGSGEAREHRGYLVRDIMAYLAKLEDVGA